MMAMTEVYCLVNRARGMEVRRTWTFLPRSFSSIISSTTCLKLQPKPHLHNHSSYDEHVSNSARESVPFVKYVMNVLTPFFAKWY